ncbi:hypothetical protein [Arcicella rosea]|uniref:Uncharacterized protein n=1 Tax=Arcicella rosea TaxID=502909 RepID=A0A841ETQ7_9BACT|nr:hypothetical protein [Arcicella rosea]MBB6003670.1 hypothetical protein [Arcicella rosea]
MIEVNQYLLHDILSPLAGGADLDEFRSLQYLDADNEQEVKKILKEYLYPYYEESTDAYKVKVKISLVFYLKKTKIDFGRLIESNLLPFNTPSEHIKLFVWIWDIFFPNEEYSLIATEEIVVKNDLYESIRLRRKN